MEIFILVSARMQTSGAELKGLRLNLPLLSEARPEPPPLPACPILPDLLLQFMCLKRSVNSLQRGGEALCAIDWPAGSAQLCCPCLTVPFPSSSKIWLRRSCGSKPFGRRSIQIRQKPRCLAERGSLEELEDGACSIY